jgi:hypothetical protein
MLPYRLSAMKVPVKRRLFFQKIFIYVIDHRLFRCRYAQIDITAAAHISTLRIVDERYDGSPTSAYRIGFLV